MRSSQYKSAPCAKRLRREISNTSENGSHDHKNHDSDDDDENPAIALMKERETVSMEDNHIYFRADVTEKSVSKLIKLIHQINRDFTTLRSSMPIAKIECVPVFLHITSMGGNCMMGYLAADIIKTSQVPIYTIIEGYAFSAATHFSVVGQRRFITESSVMLIHQLSSYGGGGTYEKVKDDAQNNELLMVRMKKLYLGHTNGKMKKSELDKLLSKDIFLDAHECVRLGLVDEIYTGEHNIKA
jgi:ATP-dependent protease ClpP protease subunit